MAKPKYLVGVDRGTGTGDWCAVVARQTEDGVLIIEKTFYGTDAIEQAKSYIDGQQFAHRWPQVDVKYTYESADEAAVKKVVQNGQT